MDESTSSELIKQHEERLDDEMGVLHNCLVEIIHKSTLSPPRILLVLELLKDEIIQISKRRYEGD